LEKTPVFNYKDFSLHIFNIQRNGYWKYEVKIQN
jgi:hypothetical protein